MSVCFTCRNCCIAWVSIYDARQWKPAVWLWCGGRKIEGGLLLTNSVPFSCCDVFSPRPCIEVDVTDSRRHFAYDPADDLTIYKTGCVDKLTDNLNHRSLLHIDRVLLSLLIMMVYVAAIRRCSVVPLINLDTRSRPTLGQRNFFPNGMLFFCFVRQVAAQYSAEICPIWIQMLIRIATDIWSLLTCSTFGQV